MNFDIYSFPELELLLTSKDINVIPIFVIKENSDNYILVFLYYVVDIDKDKKLKVVKIYSENDFNEILRKEKVLKELNEKINNLLEETNIKNEKFYYSIHSHKIDNTEFSILLFRPMHWLEVMKEVYSISGTIFNIIRNRDEFPIFEKTLYMDKYINTDLINLYEDVEQKRKRDNLKIQIKKLVKDKRFIEPFLRTYYVNPSKIKEKNKISKETLSKKLKIQNDVIMNSINNFIEKTINNGLENNFKLIKSKVKSEDKNIKKDNAISNTTNITFSILGKNNYDDVINVKIQHTGMVDKVDLSNTIKNDIKISFNNNDNLNNNIINEISNKTNDLANIDINKVIELINEIIQKRSKELETGINYEIIRGKEPIHLTEFFKINISRMLGSREIPYIELMMDLLKEVKQSENMKTIMLTSSMSKENINKEVRNFINFLKVSRYNLYKKAMTIKEMFSKDELSEIYKKIKKFIIALERDKFITKEERKFITAITKRVFKYYEVLLSPIHPIQYITENISPLSVMYGEKLIGIWFSTPSGEFDNTKNQDNNDNIDKNIQNIYRKLILSEKDLENIYNRIISNKSVINGILSLKKLL